MRPGHLGDLQDFWFGSLSGEYFEILEDRSADPIYTIRDRLHGRTGEEFKAYFRRGGKVTTTIPRTTMRGQYPYKNGSFSLRLNQLTRSHLRDAQMFKLV